MKIKRNQNYTPVKLEDLKYGDVFEYNDEVYVYMNPSYIKADCSDTTPILFVEIGKIYYLCKSTVVIYYPNAELCLGNAYRG
jgi:hypothetical protein